MEKAAEMSIARAYSWHRAASGARLMGLCRGREAFLSP